jgi:putative ABC transport system permease protein
LEAIESQNVEFFQIRVLEGDDASCLNLNRVQRPRILGIDPVTLAKRGSFRFVQILDDLDRDSGWLILKKQIDENAFPAVVDQSVATRGLDKSLGDTLTYGDESGREVRFKLVGGLASSIFQGSILVSESALRERFPTASSNRLFLIDGPEMVIPEITELLQDGMQDYGIEPVQTSVRLSEFNQVENTYLSIFLALGGMGFIRGDLIPALRNE